MQDIGASGIFSQLKKCVPICGENRVLTEEKLHPVASSMKEPCDVGIEYPGTTTYHKGQGFKDEVGVGPLKEQLCNLTAKKVADFISKNKNKLLPLNKPAGAQLKMAAFEDTTYRDDPDELNRWGKFYLPKSVTMQVIGVVEGILSRFEEIVLMICGENQHVYAYDEEELHLVASSMKELCDVGIEYPGTTTYYKGQAFKDMKKKDWEVLKAGEVGRKLDEKHKKLVATISTSFRENLK